MSENYIVSARKYRPQTFDTVVGQSHITTTLKNAIKHQQLAHAFLFCGPRGVGKTTCARILAKTINCEHPTEDMEACGTCSSCIGFKNNSLFNVFELDAASNNSVDDIRELTNQVRFAPQQGRYKVYIIDEVHMLSTQAFNAFLKTLEEPPPYAIFILATTEKHKILPTILSRCQIFDFKRITTNDIVLHLQGIALKEGMQAEEAALHIIAQKSEGCMRDALSMLDRISGFTNGMMTYANTMEHLNLLDTEFYFRLTDSLLSQDVAGTLINLDKALEKGFEGDTIVSGLAEHFRNLLLCKDPRMVKLLDIPNDHKPIFYEKANQVPPSYLISSLGIINESELEYKNANNKRLHVEMCLIRLCYVLQATTPSSNSDLGDVKKNSSSVENTINQPAYQQKPVSGEGGILPSNQPSVANQQVVNVHPEIREKANNFVNGPQVQHNQTAPNNGVPVSDLSGGREQPTARKLSKNIFANIENAVNQATSAIDVAQKIISVEEINKIFDQYKLKLQKGGESINHAQFCMMRVELLPPDEIRIIAPTEFTENYAKAERNSLIEYYRAETNMMVRITTTVVVDETVKYEPKSNVLTKAEVFEAMALKNPNLAKLREAFNFQVEY